MLVDVSDKTMLFICTLRQKGRIAEQSYVSAVVNEFYNTNTLKHKTSTGLKITAE